MHDFGGETPGGGNDAKGQDSTARYQHSALPAQRATNMVRRDCAQRDAVPALRRLVLCSSSTASPVCAWSGQRVFDGGPVRPGLANAHYCARQAFDAFVCGLPRWRGAKLQPPDWAFGSEPATAGKFVARWAMSLFLGSVAAQPGRYSLPTPELTGWLWRPPGSCAASNATTEAWLRADVCRTSARAPRGLELALERSSVGQQLLRQVPSPPPPYTTRVSYALFTSTLTAAARTATIAAATLTTTALGLQVRGNSSGRWAARTDVHWMATAGGGVTVAGLWWAAQLVRLTLSALGPCGREAVEARPSVVVRPSRLVGGGGGGAAVAAAAATAATAATDDGGASWSIALHIRRGDACERWATRRPKRAPSATQTPQRTRTQPHHPTPNTPPSTPRPQPCPKASPP